MMAMTSKTRRRVRFLRVTALIGILAVAVTASTWLIVHGRGDKHITAYLSAAVGLYPGSDVRVVGVPVGTVDSVEPQGKQVRVTMSVDHDVAVPADVSALVVTPNLVSDRYVQLAPVYTGGPQLFDGAVIPASRTGVPVELDEMFSSLDRLSTALGPGGANANGALNEFLSSSADILDGNGKKLGDMIRELGKATNTLSGSQDDLFGTIDNIQRFATMLADNDGKVRTFKTQLDNVSKIFADERDDVGAALSELADALGQVQSFVQDNRALLKSNVDKLVGTTQVLVKQRDSLAEALDRAPKALSDLLDAYDPETATFDSRANLNEFIFPLPAVGGGR